ncbi:type III-B CRISPR module RAMP protein Cmr1 [Pyrobaculum aerophilum]|uniref:type III-B CRISPR module RAMP protein Cmr1 n=1 Tax=Pyrobaculum aerophilum TaxID=13773 RepID=UPI0023F20600|nr:type III-B CRISPR module RAMP protein Cmr1 [Pyrobaculum aerophilum]MCX8137564.1 type III-B CRISPR module RAMP protein Cmr1 [Pyrobaculum aerophilum]
MRAEFDLTIATPLSVGWYEPNEVDKNFYIRPTSIKGLWRWWARAFALGALYEAGCPDLGKATEMVAQWGFGTAGEASKYKITVKVVQQPKVEKVARRQRRGIQRLDLIALSRDVEYAEGGRFTLAVEGEGPHFDLAVGILAVALTLSGVGKGGRKSLGVLDITDARGRAPRARDVKELIEAVRSGVKVSCRGSSPGLPPAPAVAKGAFEVYSANAQFRDVHNFFLRPNRARALAGNYAAPDPMDRLAWFFGLPRSQRGTGYLPPREGEEIRRASAVFAASHGRGHIYGGRTYISVFLSEDWPPRLRWIGASGSRPINITAQEVKKARDLFVSLIQKAWGAQRIWP